MKYIQIKLKPGKDESLRRFHPWVFSGAIQSMTGQPEEGDIVEVCNNRGEFIALGHYQIGSITVRILTFEKENIDLEFYKTRLRAAYDVRYSVGLIEEGYTNTYRLVHGEAITCRDSLSTSTIKQPSCRHIRRVCTTPDTFWHRLCKKSWENR